MKKLVSLAIVFMCGMLIFSGCAFQGGDAVRGVSFTSSVYYVDKGVPFKLDYRVFPSTTDTKNYAVSFDPHDTINLGKYNLDYRQGIITVVDDYEFAPLEIEIKCGSYTDLCMVNLRDYPTQVKFVDDNVDLSAGALTNLLAVGVFGEEEVILDTNKYDIVATSSDPSVVTIVDESKLLIQSTGKSGTSEISFKVCNSRGDVMPGLEAEVDVVVRNNVSSAMILVDTLDRDGNIVSGEQHIIYSGSETDEKALSGYQGKKFLVTPVFTDAKGFVIKDNNYEILSLNPNVADIIKNNDGTLCIEIKREGTVKFVLSSGIYKQDGTPFTFEFSYDVSIGTMG